MSLISRYIGITGFNLEEFHKVVLVISLWIVWSSPSSFCSRWKGARYDRDQGGRCSQLCEECFRWYSNEGEWGSSLLSLFPRYLSIFVEYYLDISIALLLFPRYLFNTCLILLGHFHNRTILDISNQKGLESSMLPPQVSILLQLACNLLQKTATNITSKIAQFWFVPDMGLLTNAGPPPWHPATAPLRVGSLFRFLLSRSISTK